MMEIAPLEADIRRRIAVGGPMGVAQYMELCLAHPERGYYATRDPSTDLERDVVGAPFEDVADLGCAQPAWQKLIEQRDRITMDAEM